MCVAAAAAAAEPKSTKKKRKEKVKTGRAGAARAEPGAPLVGTSTRKTKRKKKKKKKEKGKGRREGKGKGRREEPPHHADIRAKLLLQCDQINAGFTLPHGVVDPAQVDMRFIVPKAQLVGANPRAVCFASIAKLEAAFLLSSIYVGRWGANPRGAAALEDSRKRYWGFIEFLESGLPILVTMAVLDGPAVRFVDGKHRFCVYRDSGIECVPVMVPAAQLRTFRKRFRAPRAARRAVRQRTRNMGQSKARFDGSWHSPSRGRGSAASVAPAEEQFSSSDSDTGSDTGSSDHDSSEDDQAALGMAEPGATDGAASASDSDGGTDGDGGGGGSGSML